MSLLPICMGTHFFQNGDPMGTQFSVKWGPNGDPKTEKGPHGDRVPQMGTHLGAVGEGILLKKHPVQILLGKM